MQNSKQESAISGFSGGFNCSQSVFAAFSEKYGVSEEIARKIACGLGGGMRSAEVCGAVSGAVLVVGLKYGHSIAEDSESKSNCYAKTRELIARFREENGSIICRDILGSDISTPEGYEQARGKGLFTTTCFDMVRSAIAILEELGY